MEALSEQLLGAVHAAEPRLREVSEQVSREPVLAGGWSRKQIIGHLIDSASNNHQRFVRALLQPSLDFPAYDQDGNVRVQNVQEADWQLLVSLWGAYNRYLAHLIAGIPEEKLETPCHVGTGNAMSLSFLATDYLTHLRHHLGQIGLADS